MRYTPLRILSVFLFALAVNVVGWLTTCAAATFELAKRPDGTLTQGVKVEGEIAPGDAKKLLGFYNTYAEMMSPVYLRSKGGNVEEAMKMGKVIRRLRLETRVPIFWDAGIAPTETIKLDHQDNMICASACFLVYAGGATRFGNYLAMHRPFLPREEARKLSDAEYETLQKQMAQTVSAYLVNMEVDHYWIDRMFSANSQEHYLPTWAEANNEVRHLMGMVPSLTEIVLSKCNQDPDLDRKLRALRNSRDDQGKIEQLMQDANVFFECQKSVLSDMQRAAFDRENDVALNDKCKQFPQLTDIGMSTLKVLIQQGANVTDGEKAMMLQLHTKYDARTQCWSQASYALHFAALNRWSEEKKRDKREIRIATQRDISDLDINRLSPAEMAKKGKEAYEAEDYTAAMRLFKKGAELGNAESMMGMSWLYENGRGVPQDETQALRWRRIAAERGNTAAMWLLGGAYEEGKVVAQDYGEAMRYYKMAADRNDVSAITSIARLYERGLGVTQDYAEAIRWLKKAANLGDSFSVYSVGMYYVFGWGVPKDKNEARVWMKKAAALGQSGATRWLIDNP
jgi:TPR repeat protein